MNTDGEPSQNEHKRYLFNVNIFDEEDAEKTDSEGKPLRILTEEEYQAEMKKAASNARKMALQEAQDSREQQVTALLSSIEQNMNVLIQAEEERDMRYQAEAVDLAMLVFQKMFPAYNEKHGFEELKNAMTEILSTQKEQKNIKVSVAPPITGDVESHLSEIKKSDGIQSFEVSGDENLSENSFVLSWADGGAVRNTEHLVSEIETLMKQMLAGKATKGHDSIENKEERTKETPAQMEEPDE